MLQPGKLFHPLGLTEGIARCAELPFASGGNSAICLAGSVDELRDVATVSPLTVTHSLLALVQTGGRRPTGADRDRLWRVFQVPLFEVVYTDDGQLLAHECLVGAHLHSAPGLQWRVDAQSGELVATRPRRWFKSAAILATGFPGSIVELPCPCGAPGILLDLEPRTCAAAAASSRAAGLSAAQTVLGLGPQS